MTEDLGGGLQAFGTIGAAVDPGNTNVPGTTGSGSLGSRNTGVGLRSKQWGEIMLGNWDLQWHTDGHDRHHVDQGARLQAIPALSFSRMVAGMRFRRSGRPYGNQIKLS